MKPGAQLLVVFFGLGCFIPDSAAVETLYFEPSEANARIVNDRLANRPLGLGGLATGDINADGKDDIALSLIGDTALEVNILLGGDLGSELLLGTDAYLRILLPFNAFTNGAIAFADLDGDGRKDLVIGEINNTHTFVLFGKNMSPGTWDLGVTPPDIDLTSLESENGSSLAPGDFNGDGIEDILIGSPSAGSWAGAAYILWGSLNPFPPTLQAGVPPAGSTIAGSVANKSLGAFVDARDVDRDGKTDLLVSCSNGCVNSYLLLGRGSFPGLWNLPATPADTTFSDGYFFPKTTALFGMEVPGDTTFLFRRKSVWPNSNEVHTLRANALPLAPGNVDLEWDPEVKGPLPWATDIAPATGDFDGDARDDLFISAAGGVVGILSSDHAPPAILESITNPSLIFLDAASLLAQGDVNGDGLRDVVYYVPVLASPEGPFGNLVIFLGFKRLDNPSVTVTPPAPTTPRVSLDLAVEGDPIDMRISGDIVDDIRGQWIPFATHRDVTLTAGSGAKRVQAAFRNAAGRESLTVETSVSLSPGVASVGVMVSNWVGNGKELICDVHLPDGGQLKAGILDDGGNRISELMDQDFAPGVWSVQWDGTNAHGKKVAPGYYILRLSINGQREDHKILVER